MNQCAAQQHFERQKAELAKEFYGSVYPDTPTARTKNAFEEGRLTTCGWRTEPLGRRRNCIVLHRPERPPTLWVPPLYRAYRTAFQEFLVAHFGFSGRLTKDWQVDHLNPRVRFRGATTAPDLYVRLALLPAGVNRAYGFVERAYCNPKVGRRLPYGWNAKQDMHWLMFCKAVGVAPPISGEFEEVVGWCGRTALELAKLVPDEPASIFEALYQMLQRPFGLPVQ